MIICILKNIILGHLSITTWWTILPTFWSGPFLISRVSRGATFCAPNPDQLCLQYLMFGEPGIC